MPKIAKKAVKRGENYPLSTSRKRAQVWKNVRGMWGEKKPDPIQELKRIRGGFDRKLSSSV
jgi:hypothetical protein